MLLLFLILSSAWNIEILVEQLLGRGRFCMQLVKEIEFGTLDPQFQRLTNQTMHLSLLTVN